MDLGLKMKQQMVAVQKGSYRERENENAKCRRDKFRNG